MNLFKLNPKALDLTHGSVMTIGNFDGVHLGHQALLHQLLQKRQRLGLVTIVVLFEPHPKELFLKGNAPKRIYTLREKIVYLQRLGVDYIFCINFTHDVAVIEPDIFIQSILFERLHVKYLLVGHDFHFGKNRQGDFRLLQYFGKKLNFQTEMFACIEKEGKRISSTGIREFLKIKDLDHAQMDLGRPYSVIGRVVHGRQLARLWGVPTANIAVLEQKLSLKGVFCVKVRIGALPQKYEGVANMGYRPTVDGSKPFLEVHLFDFDACLYGQFLEVIFLHSLRDEQKFPDVQYLRKQIEKDVIEAKAYFASKF